MIHKTTRCRQHGHREFVLEADETQVPPEAVAQLARTLEERVAAGHSVKAGDHTVMGWMLVKFEQYDADFLTLHEPDMSTLPIKWVPGVTQTIRQLILQTLMLGSVGLSPEEPVPTIQDNCFVCDRIAGSDIIMHRRPRSEENRSGWFIACLDPKHDHSDKANLRSLLLYEAFLQQKAIEAFAWFPSGSTILLDSAGGIAIEKDGQRLTVDPQSLPGQFLRLRK